MSDTYDPRDNAVKCYYEALQAVRLQCIRSGQITPRRAHTDEMKAWREYKQENTDVNV